MALSSQEENDLPLIQCFQTSLTTNPLVVEYLLTIQGTQSLKNIFYNCHLRRVVQDPR